MSENNLPDIALSIMQPWAWCIVGELQKPIENRDWKAWNSGLKFRGAVAIHAGKKFDVEALDDIIEQRHPVTGDELPLLRDEAHYREMITGRLCGGIVGVAEVVDVITESDDPWFVGPYGLVLRNARPVTFIPVSGALGFFKWREKLAA